MDQGHGSGTATPRVRATVLMAAVPCSALDLRVRMAPARALLVTQGRHGVEASGDRSADAVFTQELMASMQPTTS